jgi:hypothetical protein
MKFCITVIDGDQLRTFQAAVFPENHQRAIELVLKQHLERVRALSRQDQEHQAPPIPPKQPPPPITDPTLTQSEIARAQGYSGQFCNNCGGFRTKRTGTCVTCEDCGSNEGCG